MKKFRNCFSYVTDISSSLLSDVVQVKRKLIQLLLVKKILSKLTFDIKN